ncbi:acetoacetate--CoA ligase [soil metagenome]
MSGEAPRRVAEGDLLWEPTEGHKKRSEITRYMEWLAERGHDFRSYDELWQWSVTDLAGFWESIADFYEVLWRKPCETVLGSSSMPGAEWFRDGELNYAEHALRRRDDHPAVMFRSEHRDLTALTYAELHNLVSEAAAGLRSLGVERGDRVAAYIPNIPEALIAFLATASIGAVWSSCSPDFGTKSVIDRFAQIEPKVLIAVDGYRYGGKAFDKIDAVAALQEAMPSLETTVLVPYLDDSPDAARLTSARSWGELLTAGQELVFEPVPFAHPLWILYSSGTTGLPKAIVHGHGGIVLEHLKKMPLHCDLKEDDRFFWFTTTGWMMWNFLIAGLMRGMTVLLYDGSPGYPDMNALWRFAEETGMTYFGTSAPYLTACMKAGIEPGKDFDLGSLRALGSTGAPLPPEGFGWVYEHVGEDLLLGSVSGGTDVCTAFVGSCALLPVHAGELQCRGLGAKVESFDADGEAVIGEVGELVITKPMPSMPVFFWGDDDGERLRESYFSMYPGIWRHGDWIRITERGSCVIYGRSDSTLNRGGVRIGTSEFYRAAEDIEEVLESLVVDTGTLGKEGKLFLFVVLREGAELDDELTDKIRSRLRAELSPRHVPDEIHAIPEVPKTLNGKKLEVPVKKILTGTPVHEAVKADATATPDAIAFFAELAAKAS